MKPIVNKTDRARELRQSKTKSESLLWGLLRGKQLCNLKFRREHPIGPYFADLACASKKLVVEIDGDYHDHVAKNDLEREEYFRQRGWKVIRFSDVEVEDDIESVGIAIANFLEIDYQYIKRNKNGSGNKAKIEIS
jgi:very-short-patch-repair endonuclease